MVQEVVLKDIVSPQVTALLVVDVQNDFCHEKGALAERGTSMELIQQSVANLLPFIQEARRFKVPIIFVRTHHDRWNNSRTWLTRPSLKEGGAGVCATGSWGAEFYRVRPTEEDYIITKHRYSAFLGTSLEVVLRSLERRSLLLTGVATNICVETTLRDAFMRDYYTILVEDCCGAATGEEHRATCYNVDRYFGKVLTSREVVALWSGELEAKP